jgi:hypothetical protein
LNNQLRGLPDQAAGTQVPAAAMTLERSIGELELRLATLRQALRGGQPEPLDAAVKDLQVCVAQTGLLAQQFTDRHAPLVAPYRQRLKLAASELQAQREAMARASAALERAAQILVPTGAQSYDAQGQGLRDLPQGGVSV